jgi:hypothetical protein
MVFFPPLLLSLYILSITFLMATVVRSHETYYTDPSCTTNPHYSKTWSRFMAKVKSAVARLDEPTDTDFERAVKKIFKVARGERERWGRIRGLFFLSPLFLFSV